MSSYIDLTMPIAPSMPFNPDHFPPQLTTYATVPTHGWEARRLTLDSHLGTHLDAPSHFIEGGTTIEGLSLDALVGPAQVIHLTEIGAGETITAHHLPSIRDERVLIRTGWASRMLGRAEYFTQYPDLSPDAAHALVDAGVRLVGFDTPSPDYDPGETHRVLLGRGVVILENVMNLERIPDHCWIAALPMPVVGGDGSPARVIVQVDASMR